MKPEEIISQIKNTLGDYLINIDEDNQRRWIVCTIDPKIICEAASLMLKQLKCRLITATALQAEKKFEIYYHFSKDEIGSTVNLHVVLPFDLPEIASIANITEAANWIEREMHELYGITFLHHPQPEKLLSDGNWDEGVYPFRKKQGSKKVEL